MSRVMVILPYRGAGLGWTPFHRCHESQAMSVAEANECRWCGTSYRKTDMSGQCVRWSPSSSCLMGLTHGRRMQQMAWGTRLWTYTPPTACMRVSEQAFGAPAFTMGSIIMCSVMCTPCSVCTSRCGPPNRRPGQLSVSLPPRRER